MQQQNRDILLFRVSHDTLVHRDTTSIVRRVSEAKTDCERSVPSVPPTLASPRGNHHLEKPATLQVSSRADAKPTSPLCTALNEPPHEGNPTITRYSPFSLILAYCPCILAIDTRIITSFNLF